MYAKDKQTLIDRREMLRVKIESLAQEARIIRKYEKRALFRKPRPFRGRTVWSGTPGQLHFELWHHRTTVVRFHARAAHIAYGIIRGLTRDQIEPNRKPVPDNGQHQERELMKEVARLVERYGPVAGAVKMPKAA